MSAALPWILDALVLFGAVVMTVGVYGVVRMPDTYLKLHAASQLIVLGVLPVLLASALAGVRGMALRVIPIAFFLLVTTPVSAHMVARASHLRGERSYSGAAADERADQED